MNTYRIHICETGVGSTTPRDIRAHTAADALAVIEFELKVTGRCSIFKIECVDTQPYEATRPYPGYGQNCSKCGANSWLMVGGSPLLECGNCWGFGVPPAMMSQTPEADKFFNGLWGDGFWNLTPERKQILNFARRLERNKQKSENHDNQTDCPESE